MRVNTNSKGMAHNSRRGCMGELRWGKVAGAERLGHTDANFNERIRIEVKSITETRW